MYVNMDEMLRKAGPENYAVPAFNIVNGVMASAVIDAAASCGSAVILQVSEKPSKTIGPKRVADFVRPLAEDAPIPVALHLDHCSDPDLAKELNAIVSKNVTAVYSSNDFAGLVAKAVEN